MKHLVSIDFCFQGGSSSIKTQTFFQSLYYLKNSFLKKKKSIVELNYNSPVYLQQLISKAN